MYICVSSENMVPTPLFQKRRMTESKSNRVKILEDIWLFISSY